MPLPKQLNMLWLLQKPMQRSRVNQFSWHRRKDYGEVSWKAPIEINAFEVPVKEKVDLLLQVNDLALTNGASFVNSVIFAVNEQKYFASTDGSYIDQDIHRIYPTFNVTKDRPHHRKV